MIRKLFRDVGKDMWLFEQPLYEILRTTCMILKYGIVLGPSLAWKEIVYLVSVSSFLLKYLLTVYVDLQRYGTKLDQLNNFKLGYLLHNRNQDLEELDPLRQLNSFLLVPISIYFSQIAPFEEPL